MSLRFHPFSGTFSLSEPVRPTPHARMVANEFKKPTDRPRPTDGTTAADSYGTRRPPDEMIERESDGRAASVLQTSFRRQAAQEIGGASEQASGGRRRQSPLESARVQITDAATGARPTAPSTSAAAAGRRRERGPAPSGVYTSNRARI